LEGIAIIGSGHVGLSMFCDFKVRLNKLSYMPKIFSLSERQKRDNIGTLRFNDLFNMSTHEVELTKGCMLSFFHKESIEWIGHAKYIIITVPDIPFLRPKVVNTLIENIDLTDKVLVFCRAGQAGTPFFSKLIKMDPRLHNCHIIFIEDSFYGTRVLEQTVNCKRKYCINISIVSKDTGYAENCLRLIFPKKSFSEYDSWPHFTKKRQSELLFDPLGYIIHVGIAFYSKNIEATRKNITYLHYTEGIDEELALKLELLDKERVSIAQSFGVNAETFPKIISRQYEKPIASSFYEMMQSCKDIYKSRSHENISNLCSSRFVFEDIPALFTMLKLSEITEVDVTETKRFALEIEMLLSSMNVNSSQLKFYIDNFPICDSPDDFINLLNNPLLR